MPADFAGMAGSLEGYEDDSHGQLAHILDSIRREENAMPVVGDAEDKQAYSLFETNHPHVEVHDENGESYDECEQIHMAERMVRKYSLRWGIENGFKIFKKSMVRTAS